MELLKALNGMSPIGVIALLGYIIYLLVNTRKGVSRVRDNHLHNLPVMEVNVAKLVSLAEQNQALQREQMDMLRSINDNLVWVRARVNGKG